MSDLDTFQFWGEKYNAKEFRNKFSSIPFFEKNSAKNKCIDMIEGNKVLDIGCGLGYFVMSAGVCFPEKQIDGCDYFSDNIEGAKFLFPEHKNHFFEASVYQLEFEAGYYDCITFQAVIEHLEQAALAVKQINQSLKINGYLIVTTDNPYGLCFLFSFFKNEIMNMIRRILGKKPVLFPAIFNPDVEYARHVYAWTPSTLLALLTVNGFEYNELRYGNYPKGLFGRFLAYFFPYLGTVQIMKVKKIKESSKHFV